MTGDGKGGFKETTGSPFDLGRAAWHLTVADVNGDGGPDVVTSDLEAHRIVVWAARYHVIRTVPSDAAPSSV